MSVTQIPVHVQAAHDRITGDLQDTEWTASLEDVVARGRQSSWFTVAVRRASARYTLSKTVKELGAVSETAPRNEVREIGDPPSQDAVSSFKPKSPMGGQIGRPESPANVPAPRDSTISFGELPTIIDMGTGKHGFVIAFDTEFTSAVNDEGKPVRVIDSYQFAVFDPFDPTLRVEIAILPLQGQRILVEDALAIVVRESGLWEVAGLDNPQGVPRRHFWVSGDYAKSLQRLYSMKRLDIVLAGHFLNADLTTFARPAPQRRGGDRYNDMLRMVTSASGGLVSLQPRHIIAKNGDSSGSRWLPMSITVRDTMGQTAPESKSLAALGKSCGVLKLDIGDAIEDMTAYRRFHLYDFLEYGMNDASIVLEYLAVLWGIDAVPPVTISGGGAHALRAGIMRYWDISDGPGSGALFRAKFQGLIVKSEVGSDDDGHSFYAVRDLAPVDGDANQAHSAFKSAFHGGLNASLKIGGFL